MKNSTSATLIIFCVFAVSVLTVLMFGVGAYKNMTDISREGYDERVCLSYIWTKVKNGDAAEAVYVTDFDGLPALCIDEVYGGDKYHTVIYHYEGWVNELFYEDGLDFSPGDGMPVLKNEALSFERLEAGLIKISAGAESVFISPRGQSGIALAKEGP